jgi:hypothetical protein
MESLHCIIGQYLWTGFTSRQTFRLRLFISEVGIQSHEEGKVLTISEDVKTPCPPVVLHESETWESETFNKPLKRTYAVGGKQKHSDCINIYHVLSCTFVDFMKTFPDDDYATDCCKFIKLDLMDHPGLSQKEFFGLFVTCNACRFVITHQMFHKHCCNPVVPTSG